MIQIERVGYLGKIERFLQGPAVVAVVGLRRVGKSIILRQLRDRLNASGVVVYVDKEDLSFDSVRNANDLVAYVRAKRNAAGPCSVIVDEVQQIEDWERGVASLQGRDDTRVIISGSNSTLFSGELATLLAGRYAMIRVLPLSLDEFRRLYELGDGTPLESADLLVTYRKLGGLPGILHTDLEPDVVTQMQRDIYSTIALRDVISRRSIRNVSSFESVVRFAMDNVGNLTTAKRIADYMKASGRQASTDTVLDYLSYLCDAFVLDRVDRYEIRGKRHLQINSKYYLGDLGLRSGLLGFNDQSIAGDLENLVYHELLRRDYHVFVGSLGDREVDFVVQASEGLLYVQVSYLLATEETVRREITPLVSIEDAYPKVVISMDRTAPGGLKGVRHINVLDFLGGAELPV